MKATETTKEMAVARGFFHCDGLAPFHGRYLDYNSRSEVGRTSCGSLSHISPSLEIELVRAAYALRAGQLPLAQLALFAHLQGRRTRPSSSRPLPSRSVRRVLEASVLGGIGGFGHLCRETVVSSKFKLSKRLPDCTYLTIAHCVLEALGGRVVRNGGHCVLCGLCCSCEVVREGGRWCASCR